MGIKFDKGDMANLRKKLDVDAIPKLRGPLNLEANKIMTAAKRITPVDTGTLRGSGHVQTPRVGGTTLSITLGFGGAASGYALVQHERTDLRHRGRQQAKFLEQPAKAAAKGLGNRLTRQLDLW